MKGRAIFLLQNSENNKIKDIIAIKAKKNDIVIIPPNYEHLMINIGKTDLKTCNWVTRVFPSNIYKPFKARHGFSYCALKSLFGIKWVKNPNYELIPHIRFAKPNKFYNFNIEKNQPLYKLIDNLNKLDFLKSPQKYNWS